MRVGKWQHEMSLFSSMTVGETDYDDAPERFLHAVRDGAIVRLER